MADDIDDNHDADEPPTIPAFLATTTDEQRKMFVARFNSARVTSVEPIGENGALVEFVCDADQDTISIAGPNGRWDIIPLERRQLVTFDVRPYLNNEGKVSR